MRSESVVKFCQIFYWIEKSYEKCLIYSFVEKCTCKRAHPSLGRGERLAGAEASHRELQEAASYSQTQTFAQEISLAASMSLQPAAA